MRIPNDDAFFAAVTTAQQKFNPKRVATEAVAVVPLAEGGYAVRLVGLGPGGRHWIKGEEEVIYDLSRLLLVKEKFTSDRRVLTFLLRKLEQAGPSYEWQLIDPRTGYPRMAGAEPLAVAFNCVI